MAEDLGAVFLRIGLSAKEVEGVLRNPALCERLKAALEGAGLAGGCDRTVGNLFYSLVASMPVTLSGRIPFVAECIARGLIRSQPTLTTAINFMKSLPTPETAFERSAFEEACGIGVSVSAEELDAAVADIMARYHGELVADRYCFPVGKLLGELKKGKLRFADGGLRKTKLDAAVLGLLGPRTRDDEEAIAKGRKRPTKPGEAAAPAAAAPAAEAAAPCASPAPSGPVDAAPGLEPLMSTGFVARDLQAAVNSEALLREHLSVTGGRLRTRFPPEPNGFLHIGHAKSCHLNFLTAFEIAGKPGNCIFRYDDTNPEAETLEYIASQAEDVAWLGWTPMCTNFTSDYFPRLHAFAVELIKRGKAYVCHLSKEDTEKLHEAARTGVGNKYSPYRERSVEENLRLFEDMRKGKYEEHAAVLRLKVNMDSPNPCMWDPVAYRIKYVPHPHAGAVWCIYPSYDFTHCIIDSIEHIDYSLCTLEFEVRRDIYYWVLESLDLYRPRVWEFSRLNLTRTVLSKRKILRLVKTKVVRGWDDPRILTIKGLRRRGYTPEALNAFCADIGVTRNSNVIQIERLEYWARWHLNAVAPRRMGVTDPIKLVITNLPPDHRRSITVPDYPAAPEKGSHEIVFTSTVFIDREDFRLEDSHNFYGLAPGKVVGLKYAHRVRCDGVTRDATDRVVELQCSLADDGPKPNGFIHWVPATAAHAEIRLYNHLFSTLEPGASKTWLSELNPTSEVVCDALLGDGFEGAKVFDHYQLERLGYFVVDPDSTADHLVLCRTVTLRESAGAKKLKKGGAAAEPAPAA